MVSYITVTYGDSPIVAPSKAYNTMCIIGKASGSTQTVADISGSALTSIVEGGDWAETDKLIIAARKFLALNPSGTLVLCGLGTAGSAITLVELSYNGTTDSVQSWASRYSPVTSMTVIEVYVDDPSRFGTITGVDPDDGSYTTIAGWYQLDTSDTSGAEELSNAVKTGVYTFDNSTVSTILTIDAGTSQAPITIDPENDRVRCTITPTALSAAFNQLTEPGIKFEMFTFAYDPALPCPLTPTGSETASEFRYHEDNCISGTGGSWLEDVFLGVSMAGQFNSMKQRCMFAFSIPEKQKPQYVIDANYAAGTAYSATGNLYEEIGDLIGANKFICGFSTKQTYSTVAHDAALAAMATLSKNPKRRNLTFRPEAIPNDEWPDQPEFKQWRRAQINPFVYNEDSEGNQWGAGYTLGTGNDSKINFIRCKNILTYNITAALQTVLNSSETKYDASGISSIKNAIIAVLNASVGLYIDGVPVNAVVIPIEYHVLNENKLNDGEAIVLASARASGIVDNISISYNWSGDVEFINIVALLPEA